MNQVWRFLRSVLAVVVGYGVMVVLITLVQETLFGGVSFHGSSVPELMGAGALTFLAAIGGGLVAASLASRRPRLHALAMGALVVVETTALLVTGRVGGPLWFDLAAAGSLIVGIFLGAEVFLVFERRAIPAVIPRSGGSS